jgi:hypothetical protein
MKSKELLEKLSNYQFLKKDTAPSAAKFTFSLDTEPLTVCWN